MPLPPVYHPDPSPDNDLDYAHVANGTNDQLGGVDDCNSAEKKPLSTRLREAAQLAALLTPG